MPAEPQSASRAAIPGMDAAHTFQRRWPYAHILSPLNDRSSRVNLATYPASIFNTIGIQINIAFVKEGTYHASPATLLVVEMTQDLPRTTAAMGFEVRLDSTGVSKRFNGVRAEPAFVCGMGPARIQEIPPADVPTQRPLTLTMRQTPRGAIAFVQAATPNWKGLPRTCTFGFVVAHSTPIRLLLLPSASGSRRYTIFRRSKITPFYLDHITETPEEIVTCSLQVRGECHQTCAEFGAEHMTPEVWKEFLDETSRATFDGESPNKGWVKYLSPA